MQTNTETTTTRRINYGPSQARVMQCFSKDRPQDRMSRHDISILTGMSRETVRKAASRLVKRGDLTMESEGKSFYYKLVVQAKA